MGVVGVLQFEVLEHRLKNEYGVEILRTNLNYRHARWAAPKNPAEPFEPKKLTITSTSMLVLDKDDAPVILFESEWGISWALERNSNLLLQEIHEQ